jgi:hypothetical protein
MKNERRTMKLTGQDIHQAYRTVDPDNAPHWDELPTLVQMKYDDVANELNTQFGEDSVTISAARCPQCNEMLQSEHAEAHACWQKEVS